MAKAPNPSVSTMAESPISGLASVALKPGKYRPWGIGAGAVNQRSPSALRRIPNSVPLRAMAVTSVQPGSPTAVSMVTFAAAMATFRKN